MGLTIALDSHKRYSLSSVEDKRRRIVEEVRIEHGRGRIWEYLSRFPKGTPVALETIGNWYWIVDEIEEAGLIPRLVHAGKAKRRMGELNKTDKLDVRGLNRLQRNETLPTVWIPPKEIRDRRDLARTGMVFAAHRTRLKNRIQATPAKYAPHHQDDVRDVFGKRVREVLKQRIKRLPQGRRRIS